MVTPFPVGSGVDFVARTLSAELGQKWKTQAMIDNRPGGSGFVAIGDFKQAAPDGYTLLLAANDQLVVNRAVYKQLPYDTAKDMVPVTGVYKSTFILAASKKSGIRSVAELTARARAEPGKITYASLGKGSLGHISAEMFNAEIGTSMLHIPFRDVGQLNTALGNGEVDTVFLTMATLDSQVKAGRVVPLASLSAARQSQYPDLPTLAEAGGPADLFIHGWLALLAPPNVPKDVLAKLKDDVSSVVATPAFQAKLDTLGFQAWPSSAKEIDQLAADELKTYRGVTEKPGMQLD
jgi:tripartite-type tricarboxylate transporter receptor subunit TctC